MESISITSSLLEIFVFFRPDPSENESAFLEALEKNISQDLWKGTDKYWSQTSIQKFRETAILHLTQKLPYNSSFAEIQSYWQEISRDFHQSYWNEKPLLRKEKVPLTAQQKITRHIGAYLLILFEVSVGVRTTVTYFGARANFQGNSRGVLVGASVFFILLISATIYIFRDYFSADD